MEGPLSGVRKTFFHDLTNNYLKKQKNSFLYRAFWSENRQGLLKTLLELLDKEPPGPEDASQLRALLDAAIQEPPGPEDEVRLRALLREVMETCPAWAAKCLPLRRQKLRLRRNFWEELWLNDAGRCAKLISNEEYCLWLVQYLAVHDIYYKTNIYYYKTTYATEKSVLGSGHKWLRPLLKVGLEMDESELKQAIKARRKERKKPRKTAGAEAEPFTEEPGAVLSKADVEEALAMLEEQIQADRDKIAKRLHRLKYVKRVKDGRVKEGADYLPWLIERLEWMALHIKIKNWLQDSGYPLVSLEGAKKPSEKKKARKSDFTMRLFEAYCNSAEGYALYKKTVDDGADSGDWHLEGQVFCVLGTNPDPDRLKELLEEQAAKRDEYPHFYLPLAVHLRSGCVFFLAGKGNYEAVYQGHKKEAEYRETEARYCFDFLRLAEDDSADSESEELSMRIPGDRMFSLFPTFHEYAEYNYEAVLEDFKWYCEERSEDDENPLRAIREYNNQEPVCIPKSLHWAFGA